MTDIPWSLRRFFSNQEKYFYTRGRTPTANSSFLYNAILRIKVLGRIFFRRSEPLIGNLLSIITLILFLLDQRKCVLTWSRILSHSFKDLSRTKIKNQESRINKKIFLYSLTHWLRRRTLTASSYFLYDTMSRIKILAERVFFHRSELLIWIILGVALIFIFESTEVCFRCHIYKKISFKNEIYFFECNVHNHVHSLCGYCSNWKNWQINDFIFTIPSICPTFLPSTREKAIFPKNLCKHLSKLLNQEKDFTRARSTPGSSRVNVYSHTMITSRVSSHNGIFSPEIIALANAPTLLVQSSTKPSFFRTQRMRSCSQSVLQMFALIYLLAKRNPVKEQNREESAFVESREH